MGPLTYCNISIFKISNFGESTLCFACLLSFLVGGYCGYFPIRVVAPLGKAPVGSQKVVAPVLSVTGLGMVLLWWVVVLNSEL
mgnify:CR=1 FL=1